MNCLQSIDNEGLGRLNIFEYLLGTPDQACFLLVDLLSLLFFNDSFSFYGFHFGNRFILLPSIFGTSLMIYLFQYFLRISAFMGVRVIIDVN